MATVNDVPHEFQPVSIEQAPTPRSVALARSEQREDRRRAGCDPETGALQPLQRVRPPLRPSTLSLEELAQCHSDVEQALARYGFREVCRSMILHAPDLHVDIEGQTLDDLAQGSEQP